MTLLRRTARPRPTWAVLVVLFMTPLAWRAPEAVGQAGEGVSAEELAEDRLDVLTTLAAAHYEKSALLAADDPDAAIQELRRILSLPFPEGPQVAGQLFLVHLAIIEINIEAERFAQAEAASREALEQIATDDPQGLAEIHILLAKALREQGKEQQALETLNRAIELGRSALQALD
ncbi:MAG: tetratricopeptide repeat protein [Acidobacteriota bacterium]